MQQDLTGVWTGQYAYRNGWPPVLFTATLIDSAGALSGSTHEDEPVHGMLFATVSGRRAGSVVSFTKTYEDAPATFLTVSYEGVLAPDGDEIEGVWRVAGSGSGTFLMVRPRREELRAAKVREAAV